MFEVIFILVFKNTGLLTKIQTFTADGEHILAGSTSGITGIALRLIQESGVDAVIRYFEELSNQLINYMLLLGAKAPSDLRKVPVIFSGETANYIANRGYDLVALSKNRR